jgi:type IV secretion system protein VirB9
LAGAIAGAGALSAMAAAQTAPPRITTAPLAGGPDTDQRIALANAAARVQPAREGFANAIQRYPWSDGALYQVYAAPDQVTDIILQEGEQLVGSGPVAAGDTARWIIGDTQSGAGASQRVHILIKPSASGLTTNLVINTDRRTYHLELRSTGATYMAAVSWTYAEDALIATQVKAARAAAAAPVATGLDVAALHFGYRLSGDHPPWRPERVFDDGRRVFIALPVEVRAGQLPPLFVLGPKGQAELVNYRVQDGYLIVERLFDAAELRLGDKRRVQAVRITRQPAGRGR